MNQNSNLQQIIDKSKDLTICIKCGKVTTRVLANIEMLDLGLEGIPVCKKCKDEVKEEFQLCTNSNDYYPFVKKYILNQSANKRILIPGKDF